MQQILKRLFHLAKKIKKHLIITRGEKGAISVHNHEVYEIGSKIILK